MGRAKEQRKTITHDKDNNNNNNNDDDDDKDYCLASNKAKILGVMSGMQVPSYFTMEIIVRGLGIHL